MIYELEVLLARHPDRFELVELSFDESIPNEMRGEVGEFALVRH